MDERNEVRHQLRTAEAGLLRLLECFGDTLAARESWKNHLDGLDAIRYYLMQKHHWLPAQLNSMSWDELRFAMTEELTGWTAPPEAR